MRFYYAIVALLGLLERRCQTCKRLLGYKRSRGMKLPKGMKPISHGWCTRCMAEFQAKEDESAEERQRQHRMNSQPYPGEFGVDKERPWAFRRQRRSTKTLRRTTGGWSGAVAAPEHNHN